MRRGARGGIVFSPFGDGSETQDDLLYGQNFVRNVVHFVRLGAGGEDGRRSSSPTLNLKPTVFLTHGSSCLAWRKRSARSGEGPPDPMVHDQRKAAVSALKYWPP